MKNKLYSINEVNFKTCIYALDVHQDHLKMYEDMFHENPSEIKSTFYDLQTGYLRGLKDMLGLVLKGNGLSLNQDADGKYYIRETDENLAKNTTASMEG